MHCETTTFSTVEEILFHTVKTGGLRLTTQQNGKNIGGGWHSELGVKPPQPPVIPTLGEHIETN